MTELLDCKDELRASGTVPYYTYAEDPLTGCYYRCERCGFGIHAGDFMQRPKLRMRRGNKRGWHYDCNDPKFDAPQQMMAEDRWAAEPRGSKSKVDKYFFNGRR